MLLAWHASGAQTQLAVAVMLTLGSVLCLLFALLCPPQPSLRPYHRADWQILPVAASRLGSLRGTDSVHQLRTQFEVFMEL